MWDWLLVFSAIVFLYFFYYRPQKSKQKYTEALKAHGFRVYQYPFNPFFIPSMSKMQYDQNKYGDCLKSFKYQFQQYDVAVGNFLHRPYLNVLSPVLIKQFFERDNDWCYIKQPICMAPLERILGRGLVLSQGDRWKQKRRIISGVFNFNFVVGLFEQMKQKCEESMTILEQKSARAEDGKYEYELIDYGRYVFSAITIEGFLGEKTSELTIDGENPVSLIIEVVDQAIKELDDAVGALLGNKFLSLGLRAKDRKINRKLNKMNSWALQVIQKRLSSADKAAPKKQKDILTEIMNNFTQIEDKLALKMELLDEFKSFYFAGSDTTTHLMNAMLYRVFKDKQVEAKLREEVQKFVSNGKLTYEILRDMEFVEAVQKQALRMNGPISRSAPRRVIKDHYLGKVPIYKGTVLDFFSYTQQHNPEIFKDPHKFRPERWLNGQCENIDIFCNVAFGGGMRACIGKQLAIISSKLALVMFLMRYKQVEILDQMRVIITTIFEGSRYRAKLKKA